MSLKELEDSFNISVVTFPSYNFGANGQLKAVSGNKLTEETQLYKEGNKGYYFFD
jgi:hypothetical protein